MVVSIYCQASYATPSYIGRTCGIAELCSLAVSGVRLCASSAKKPEEKRRTGTPHTVRAADQHEPYQDRFSLGRRLAGFQPVAQRLEESRTPQHMSPLQSKGMGQAVRLPHP